MIKAFFLDIDGTLVLGDPDNRYIPEYNLGAMRDLLRNNVKLVTASGRDYQFTRDAINKLHGFSCDAIAQNGAIIICDNKVVVRHYCPRKKLLAVAWKLKGQEDITGLGVAYEDVGYFNIIDKDSGLRVDAKADFGSAKVRSDITYFDVLSTSKYGDPLRMMIYCDNYEITNKWVEILNKEFGADLEICATAAHTLEIVAKGINKGKAVIELCDYYGYDLAEIAAIGDSDNDISMLSLTKHRYLMAESSEKVKALAGKVVETVAEAASDIIAYNKRETDNK